MNRRSFLGALSTATVGACVTVKLPTAWLPQPVRRYAAIKYLCKHYNAWTKGLSASNCPGGMIVGRDLFEAYESEISPLLRCGVYEPAGFCNDLKFKACQMTYEDDRGWGVLIYNRTDWPAAVNRLGAARRT